MNLAPCPDCGNPCSLLAQTCPKCVRPFQRGELEHIAMASEPLTPTQSAPLVADTQTPVPTANEYAAAIGCVGVAVLFIVLALMCMSGGSNSSANCEKERL